MTNSLRSMPLDHRRALEPQPAMAQRTQPVLARQPAQVRHLALEHPHPARLAHLLERERHPVLALQPLNLSVHRPALALHRLKARAVLLGRPPASAQQPASARLMCAARVLRPVSVRRPELAPACWGRSVSLQA